MLASSHSISYVACFGVLFLCTRLTESKKPKELQVITQYKPEECYEMADIGDEVFVHYTGKLETGQVFDSSKEGGRGPLPFKLGEGRVIPGWEQGIRGMCVGEKRKLIIPPHLAYGTNGHPPTIPPEATLTFETELVNINKQAFEYDVIGFLQFLSLPVAVCVIVYYMYDRYRKEQVKQKEAKASNKGERRERTSKKKKN